MGKNRVDPNETPEARFKRLAQYRTQRVINSLRILSHCSNSYNYSYTDSDIQKIFQAIQEELELTESKFKGGNSRSEFRL